MTPGDRFNEMALLVMGAALAGPVFLSPLLLLLLSPSFSLPFSPGLPNRDACVYCCLFPSGNHCFTVGFCDEGFCRLSFISPHCNLNLFVFVCPLSASKLPLLVSLSVCLSDYLSVSSLTASLFVCSLIFCHYCHLCLSLLQCTKRQSLD